MPHDMDRRTARQARARSEGDDGPVPDETDLDRAAAALLTTSRALIGVSLRSIAAAPVEVTLPQHRLLVRLASRGPQTVSGLGAELGMGQPATTRLVDRLERAGLVDRRRSATDSRAVEVVLLTRGREVLDAVTAARRAELAGLVDQLSPTERRALARGLTALNRVAGEPPDAEWPT